MRLRHEFLLALGIATPLWVRQLRFERQATSALARYADDWNKEIGRAFRQHERVWEQTIKEIERAFKDSARRGVEL